MNLVKFTKHMEKVIEDGLLEKDMPWVFVTIHEGKFVVLSTATDTHQFLVEAVFTAGEGIDAMNPERN